jgi:hypothetical protein
MSNRDPTIKTTQKTKESLNSDGQQFYQYKQNKAKKNPTT